jgi:hypothetical protein
MKVPAWKVKKGGRAELRGHLRAGAPFELTQALRRHHEDAHDRPERHDRDFHPIEHQQQKTVPAPKQHPDQGNEVGRQ